MIATNFLIGSVPNTFLTSLSVVLLSFLLLMLLIKKFAWGPVSKMLDERANKIAGDLDSAEADRNEANRLVKEKEDLLANSRNEATTIVRKAKETAEREAHDIVSNAHEEGRRYLEQAKREIEREREVMIEAAKNEVADLSIQIAEKIIRKELNAETHQELINSYIEGLGSQDES
ncbi:F0F1 ATP synthase subunit B [Vagococcus xieshaowenii]|uniref:ATP synthase subunit b n=1 Tax=Vagococcus xieshaowenii TaxID=2562451 RepID=A0A4Z0DD07_9ENTE|nr:F0F1 ATP synthase subunit B [Vagococcus xieshaowenii]QCA28507.1 F0F1 ATP synthase subunit B [Vagococcus xieshaowenii]TFZ42739.1 F0F1 ATP synthase subunit B [Vagococcus xieshaowenii]